MKGPSATLHHDQSHSLHPNPTDERKQGHKIKAMDAGSSVAGDVPVSGNMDRDDYEQKYVRSAAEKHEVASNSTLSISHSESLTIPLPVSMKFEVKKNPSKRKRLNIFQE